MNQIKPHLSNHHKFKKSFISKIFFLFVLFINGFAMHSQDIEDLDSLLIDRDIENYSFRIFTNFKANKFTIKNDDSKAKFVPNNRHGLGFGFANRKMIVDLAFNLKNPNRENTRRFDLQGTTILWNRHYVGAVVQTYKGFRSKNNFDQPTVLEVMYVL